MTANGYTGNTPGGGGGGGAVDSVNGRTGAVTLSKADVSLSAVDNTADTGKPVSTAQATAIALKAPIASPTFTGTVGGVTKAMVGLGSVDNTADAAKVIAESQVTGLVTDLSTLTSAVALKAPIASPTFTGTVAGVTKAMVGLGNVDNTADASKTFTESQVTNLTSDLAAKAPLASPTLTGVPAAPTAAAATSTTQVATTAFVTTADNLKAPLASPALTGTPTAPTATALDNSTKLATTAYADAADAVNFPMLKWNGSAYVVATGAKVYVGAGTPSTPADGSVWFTS